MPGCGSSHTAFAHRLDGLNMPLEAGDLALKLLHGVEKVAAVMRCLVRIGDASVASPARVSALDLAEGHLGYALSGATPGLPAAGKLRRRSWVCAIRSSAWATVNSAPVTRLS